MEKRRIWITLIMILLGAGVCISTSVFAEKKTIAIETVSEDRELTMDTQTIESSADVFESVTSFPVYICGEVVNPGVYEIFDSVYLYELIEMAGGLSDSADEEHIDMVYRIDTSQSIYIPSVSEPSSDPDSFSEQENTDRWTPRTGTGTSSARRVNINEADVKTLMTLPGRGEKTAEKIVSYREQNGPFLSAEDIMKVPGIGESKYENIKDTICV